MAFGSIVFLLLLYYIRPQDWVPGMSGFNMIKLVVATAIIGLMKRDREEPRWRFMSSPHEWAIMIFYVYVVLTAVDPMAAATDLGALVVFSFLGLHTLTTEVLLERYLRWWLIALVGVVVMVGVTQMGMDITGVLPLIDKLDGRFFLNTFTLNNPNALGHTIVAALPLAYYLWFWDSSAFSRMRAVVFCAVGIWSVIPTESKGSFISGAVSFLISFLFGRKLLVQVVVGLAALATGGTILATLPRMEGMKSLGSDQGVQGRMLAWSMARAVTLAQPTGMGYKQFLALIRWEGLLVEKSTHSSYVQVGADLGVIGLTLYVGMLIACGRSLVQYPGLNPPMERCRRALFALLLGMCISAWMINREYYTEVFCMMGAVAAYHQLSVKQRREAAVAEMERLVALADASGEAAIPESGLLPAFEKSAPTPNGKAAEDDDYGLPALDGLGRIAKAERVPGLWTRLGMLDVLMAIAAGQLTLQFWDYVMASIK